MDYVPTQPLPSPPPSLATIPEGDKDADDVDDEEPLVISESPLPASASAPTHPVAPLPSAPSLEPELRWLTRIRRAPRCFSPDASEEDTINTLLSTPILPTSTDDMEPDPASMKDVLSSPNCPHWIQAIRDELQSLHDN
eukprot:TRINITY_DN18019_c0_g1_i1.p1 TRINITY_DN18019_c0_g1~~TRINITY_DN18019_c0_g1_i1.p1  ORF type:complete len:139 (+),score=15.61 TRINITY_DN18019_c0_g1_i1:420-836(+)